VIFGFLDLAFDNPGSFAAFGKVVFCGLATVFWTELAALVLGNAFFDNAALGNAVFGATGFLGEGTFWDNAAFLATDFLGEVSFLVLLNAAFLATGFLGEVSFLVFGNAAFGATGFLGEVILLGNAVLGVLGGVCFFVLVDFLLIGWEVLVIVFWDFSGLDLGRLFFDIANLLILE